MMAALGAGCTKKPPPDQKLADGLYWLSDSLTGIKVKYSTRFEARGYEFVDPRILLPLQNARVAVEYDVVVYADSFSKLILFTVYLCLKSKRLRESA